MKNTDSRMAHLERLFGSRAAVARAAGADVGAVHRWPPKSGIAVKYQERLLREALARELPIDEVAWGAGVRYCACCGIAIEDTIREILRASA